MNLKHKVAVLAGICLVAALAGPPALAQGGTDTETGANGSMLVPGSKFETLPDGNIWHPASKGTCPGKLAGFTYSEPTLFKQDGTDVGCVYEGDDGSSHLTLYFYQDVKIPTAEKMLGGSIAAILQRFPEAEHQPEDSEACGMQIQLINGIMGLSEDELENGSEITVGGDTPCHVFRIDYGATIIVVEKIGPWFLKVRVTGKLQDGAADALVERAVRIATLQHASMSGHPAPFSLLETLEN